MGVARRSAGAVAAGVLASGVLLCGSAWAQEDPCAPGADGSVPEACQSGPAEPAPDEPARDEPDSTEPGTTEPAPDDCPDQPVEPGDGEVVDGGAATEPSAGQDEPAEEPERSAEQPATEPGAPGPDEPVEGPAGEQPSSDEPGVVCAYGLPGTAGGGAAETAAGGRDSAGRSPTLTQLPRTGPQDRVVAAAVVGGALVLVGAAAATAGRRRPTQP